MRLRFGRVFGLAQEASEADVRQHAKHSRDRLSVVVSELSGGHFFSWVANSFNISLFFSSFFVFPSLHLASLSLYLLLFLPLISLPIPLLSLFFFSLSILSSFYLSLVLVAIAPIASPAYVIQQSIHFRGIHYRFFATVVTVIDIVRRSARLSVSAASMRSPFGICININTSIITTIVINRHRCRNRRRLSMINPSSIDYHRSVVMQQLASSKFFQ